MGLAALQKRLLKDVFKEEFDISNYDMGKKMIEERLCNQNVLLVLDDVDGKEQVDALAGELKWFGQGSRVIITTRDKHILNVAKVDENKIYSSQLLDLEQSLQLFSWHAFSKEQPPDDYMELSRDVANYSGGLPLTLEVLGSYLASVSNKKVWKATLKKLKKIPHIDVQTRLQISYEKLEDDDQKNIFLDAACFFIGWEKETVMSIWKACDYEPEAAVDKLIKRSLLNFEGYGGCCLRMHDQIRDMGREIVRKESPMDPSKRSRLWSPDEISEVFDGHKGTNKIEGMILPSELQSVYLTSKHFEMMSNLRFLDINSENFTGECLPFALRWLRWNGYSRAILPTNSYHKRLVSLSLSSSVIVQAWHESPRQKNELFQKLKVLNLSGCKCLSKSPDFSWFPHLKRLDLGYCRSLDTLDESIGLLSRLKNLILKFCNSLKKLPESIGGLKSLVKLDLTETRIEELPDSICKLSSLKELLLQMNTSLKKLPETIGELESLVELRLSNVTMIEELCDGVGLLKKLEVLDVQGCCKLEKLPRSMGRMRCLQNINLNGTKVSELPDDFSRVSNLVELKLPSMLQTLPADLSHWNNLQQLEFCYCEKLEYLPELPSNLVVLCCVHCTSLVRLPDLVSLKNLKVLKLDFCPNLEEIPGLEGTESLEELLAPECYKLTDATRKILGQGCLLLPSSLRSQKEIYSLGANDGIDKKGLTLCVVWKFKYWQSFEQQGQLATIYLDIYASISQKKRTIRCLHTIRIEDVKFITDEDLIYIHHFKGFDWFGTPLQGKDAIKIIYIRPSDPYTRSDPSIGPSKPVPHSTVKFWKLLFDNRTEQQDPYQDLSAMMVADFFSWSSIEGIGKDKKKKNRRSLSI